MPLSEGIDSQWTRFTSVPAAYSMAWYVRGTSPSAITAKADDLRQRKHLLACNYSGSRGNRKLAHRFCAIAGAVEVCCWLPKWGVPFAKNLPSTCMSLRTCIMECIVFMHSYCIRTTTLPLARPWDKYSRACSAWSNGNNLSTTGWI